MTNNTGHTVSVAQLAERWGVHPETIRRLLAAGLFNVPAFKAGGTWRFLVTEVEAVERGPIKDHVLNRAWCMYEDEDEDTLRANGWTPDTALERLVDAGRL